MLKGAGAIISMLKLNETGTEVKQSFIGLGSRSRNINLVQFIYLKVRYVYKNE